MYDAMFKIVVFGDAQVGKRTLARKFLKQIGAPSEDKMTIGVEFYSKNLSVDHYFLSKYNVKLQVWILRGEERFSFILPMYLKGAHGGIFLYDITNSISLAHIDEWFSLIRRELPKNQPFPILIVGNKADLSEYREVSAEDGIKTAKSCGLDRFIECSAKTGKNLEEAFEALTKLIIDNSIRHSQNNRSVGRGISRGTRKGGKRLRPQSIRAGHQDHI